MNGVVAEVLDVSFQHSHTTDKGRFLSVELDTVKRAERN